MAPHPDDETLGPGGTLLRRADEGWELHWLLVTDGQHATGEASDERREHEIEAVAGRYDFKSIRRLKMPVSALHRVPETELYEGIAGAIREAEPSEVLLPFRSDAHSDHHAVNAIGWSCSKSFRFPTVRRVLMYDTPSETDFSHPGDPFVPGVLVDVTGYLDRKIEIMGIYESELRAHPFPRSEEALRARATLYGAMAGCVAAEGFMLMRDIDRL
ncbi:MAG: PIG-L family deacetylase [Nitrospinota bacterium]|nr:PIG-L family deacetylase [Nitrospinota bacterium]MDP7664937.1 PIG-L family deacetylase [Nitrospinota bacterium]HJP13040.1 PIG-L family deacetylase [Nitrospinota bacterium]